MTELAADPERWAALVAALAALDDAAGDAADDVRAAAREQLGIAVAKLLNEAVRGWEAWSSFAWVDTVVWADEQPDAASADAAGAHGELRGWISGADGHEWFRDPLRISGRGAELELRCWPHVATDAEDAAVCVVRAPGRAAPG